MKILTLSALLCAMMALTGADEDINSLLGQNVLPALPDSEPGTEETIVALPDTKDENWTDSFIPAGETDDVQRARSCPSGWTAFNSRCFLYVPRVLNWAQAERNCQSMGGNLASVHSFQEYHEIQRMIVRVSHYSNPAWIGGSDAQQERYWLWSDGTRFSYSHWCRGEPNNDRGQHCTQINFSDQKCWDDFWCDGSLPSVCARKR
ncbi:ladderlectin-like isoform X4 [Dicentrarchus labrax]|uniref:ladderlectin-like isoform X1 n=1 Tax=Dicentrarchus labrax TaxID=13489 RepID=UPI0021F50D3D|nr:ladderlectin-like isoform X1 [Dicentrarchus labrax]XP_051251452.1 ladderlectin-like isoform X2 [Dicentrarchus labrax]XP_051251453.1 ladderlectin-like isoform X3 [Dicentrarchus labrax]XP_051251454.1 ladderlectin-like isoform X4 [Dicentrarchus labrax]